MCSNSLRSDDPAAPAGLLKHELRRCGSIVIACADRHRVPAGQALAVERFGVAREISLPALDADLDRPEFYLALNNTSRTLYLSLRCVGACPDPRTIDDRLRRIHPALTGRLMAAGEDAYAAHLELPHAIAQESGTFAVVALVTAACGLFRVLSYIARRRRREFGIRQMLGA